MTQRCLSSHGCVAFDDMVLMMVVAFTGIRDLSSASIPDVEDAVADVLSERPRELRFGGAVGADCAALSAACVGDGSACVVVVVPFKVADQPQLCRDLISRCANRIVELGLPKARWAYLRRNDRLLDDADLLVAFTDGRKSGGTAYTIGEAHNRGIEVRIVPVGAKAGAKDGRRPRQVP